MRSIELKEKTTKGTRFDSVREFIEVSPSKANRGHGVVKDDFHLENENASGGKVYWFGLGFEPGNGAQALDRLVREGWTEGTKRALDLKAQLAGDLAQIPGARAIRRKRSFGPQGDELDPHKVNMGNLDKAWTTTRRDFAPGSTVITIKTSIAGSSMRSGEELYWKGVTAALLTDILEEAGYRVEIILYMHTGDVWSGNKTYKRLYQEIPCKAPEEPLDLNRVITCTALAGFFRYFGFKARLSEPYKVVENMGVTIERPPDGTAEDHDLIINKIYDENAALEFIKNALKKFA